MQDRQKFQKTVLANGITLYTYRSPHPVCCLELILPVGAGHAVKKNGFIPGAPHFLEHTQLIRSNLYPEAYHLDRSIGLRGGHSNGITYPSTTHYELDVPATELEWACTSLVDRTFNPIFNESDITTERSVVINERNQRKFYPGKSRVSQYYHTNFLCDIEYPLEQLFGSNEDLEAMTAPVLEAMHAQITHSPDIQVLAVGPSDFKALSDQLAALPTRKKEFVSTIQPVVWEHREHHLQFFDTVPQPTLEVAWVHDRLRYPEFRAVAFIVSLLINSCHGPLYREFREEKGWTYGLDGYCVQRTHNTLFGMSFPLNTQEQAEYVQECLLERINEAVNNQSLVEDEIKRYIGNQVYGYQTASDIIGGASFDLATYGEIFTEAAWLEAVQALADPVFRKKIVDECFNPADMGSVLFMPERRQYVQARQVKP